MNDLALFDSAIRRIVSFVRNRSCGIMSILAALFFLIGCITTSFSPEDEANIERAFAAEFQEKSANDYFKCKFYGIMHGNEEEYRNQHSKLFTHAFVVKCREKAKKGDVKCQALYGSALLHGWGVMSNQVDAVKWLTKAADTDNRLIQDYLGECYFFGIELNSNVEEGIKWLQKAANLGYAPSQRLLGVCYYSGLGVTKDIELGLLLTQKAAKQGDALAEAQLWGWETTKKNQNEFDKLCDDAKHGNADAQTKLAKHYQLGGEVSFGVTVEKDVIKAFDLYSRAASNGKTEAQIELGRCYEKGIGTIEDKREAFRWYKCAADKSSAEAQRIVGWCYQAGIGVEADAEKAIEWFEKAVAQKDTFAQVMLADCYYYGEGVETNEVNDAIAVALYGEASDRGDLMATYCLGECYQNGRGVIKDSIKATRLFRKLSNGNEQFSDFDLAVKLASLRFDLPESYHFALSKISSENQPLRDKKILRNNLVVLSLLRYYKNDKYTLERLSAPPDPKENELIFQAFYGIQSKKNQPRKWETIDGNTIYGIWTTSSREMLFIRIDEGNGQYTILYTGNLCERDVNYVWEKTLDYMFERYNWIDGYMITSLNYDGIKKAARIVLDRTETGPQDLEIFQILASNAALAYLGLPNRSPYLENRPIVQVVDFNIGNLHSEGDMVKFPRLYWAATYSYENKKGITRTVKRFSPNFAMALYFVRSAMNLYDETDPILGNLDGRTKMTTDTDEGKNNNSTQKGKKEIDDIRFGSGFFVTEDGYFLTNHHVIQNARRIKILSGDTQYDALIEDYDADMDLALLKVRGNGFSAIKFSSSRVAKLGEDVFAVGYPRPTLQGASVKVTKGVISSLRGIMDDPHCYQIDAAIQPGNSGGPIVNANGDVVGIAVAKLKNTESMISSGDIAQNVNYAIKSSFALAFLDSTPECKYKTNDIETNRLGADSGLDEQVPKACGMVISYSKE